MLGNGITVISEGVGASGVLEEEEVPKAGCRKQEEHEDGEVRRETAAVLEDKANPEAASTDCFAIQAAGEA